jgi:pimeloyl-ACP methyl ester carboxylesterase
MRSCALKTLRGLAVAAGLLAMATAAMAARPNPCLELASIVSSHSNTSSHGGKTAAELFADEGRLTVFARLGVAAAHVQDHEPVGTAINEVSENADAAYAALSARIRWLEASDLEPPSGLELSPANTVDPAFCTRGLLGGVYARGNSAVLVGRVSDALFLAFRATNDGWNLSDTPVTPDALDWTEQGRHYKRYEFLLEAVADYVAANPEIGHIYVAGDSLGAAMAQKYMLKHPNDGRLRAIVFGSPGNPSIPRQDNRIWTFLNDVDPLLLVPSLKFKISGKRFIIRTGKSPAAVSGATFHSPQAYLREMQHLDDAGLDASYLRDKFEGGDITRWNSIFLRINKTADDPVDFTAGVPGRIVTEPGSKPRVMVGGGGADTIVGGFGEGDLFGLGGDDCLEPLARPERLFGGTGKDWFVLRGNYRAYGATVMDFKSGSDRVVSLGTLPAFQQVVDGKNFIRGTSATRPKPTLIYQRSTGRLWFDLDGTGVIPKFLVAKFTGEPKVLASDIDLMIPDACD